MDYVYMLRLSDGSLYTGCAKDVPKRVLLHNAGRGSKCVKGRLPAAEVYREACDTRSQALSRETAIKRLKRADKLRLLLSSLEKPEPLTLSHFERMEELERSCYGADYISPAKAAYEWYRAFPSSVFALFFQGAPAGFVNLFPVTEPVYERLTAGTFNDSGLTVSDIADPASPGKLHLFFSCIAVAPAFRGTGLSGLLLTRALAAYAPCRDRIDAVFADTVTESGARLAEKLGMAKLGASQHGTTLFRGSFDAFFENAATLLIPPPLCRKS